MNLLNAVRVSYFILYCHNYRWIALSTRIWCTTTLVHSSDLILHLHEFQLKIFALYDFRSHVSTASLLNFVQCLADTLFVLRNLVNRWFLSNDGRLVELLRVLDVRTYFFIMPQFQQDSTSINSFLHFLRNLFIFNAFASAATTYQISTSRPGEMRVPASRINRTELSYARKYSKSYFDTSVFSLLSQFYFDWKHFITVQYCCWKSSIILYLRILGGNHELDENLFLSGSFPHCWVSDPLRAVPKALCALLRNINFGLSNNRTSRRRAFAWLPLATNTALLLASLAACGFGSSTRSSGDVLSLSLSWPHASPWRTRTRRRFRAELSELLSENWTRDRR